MFFPSAYFKVPVERKKKGAFRTWEDGPRQEFCQMEITTTAAHGKISYEKSIQSSGKMPSPSHVKTTKQNIAQAFREMP